MRSIQERTRKLTRTHSLGRERKEHKGSAIDGTATYQAKIKSKFYLHVALLSSSTQLERRCRCRCGEHRLGQSKQSALLSALRLRPPRERRRASPTYSTGKRHYFVSYRSFGILMRDSRSLLHQLQPNVEHSTTAITFELFCEKHKRASQRSALCGARAGWLFVFTPNCRENEWNACSRATEMETKSTLSLHTSAARYRAVFHVEQSVRRRVYVWVRVRWCASSTRAQGDPSPVTEWIFGTFFKRLQVIAAVKSRSWARKTAIFRPKFSSWLKPSYCEWPARLL